MIRWRYNTPTRYDLEHAALITIQHAFDHIWQRHRTHCTGCDGPRYTNSRWCRNCHSRGITARPGWTIHTIRRATT